MRLDDGDHLNASENRRPLSLGPLHDTAHGYAVEIDWRASVAMTRSIAMRILAPAVMSLLACSFQADAAELIGRWQVSAPTGSAAFEFLDSPSSKIAGTYRYSPPDCQGDLVQLSVQPPTYMFRERPSNSRVCGTGSIVRVAVISPNAIRVDRIHPTSGKVQSTWDIAKGPGESATASGAPAPMTTSQYSSATAVFGPSVGSTPQVYGCGRYQSGLGKELCVNYGITGGELDILVRELGPQGRLSEKTIRRYRAGAIASQFAPLADSVYQWRRQSVDTNGDGIPDWELDTDVSRWWLFLSDGFGAATYVRKDKSGIVRDVAIVFEGTTAWSIPDWVSNYWALANADPQLISASEYVLKVRKKYGAVQGRITCVGHSLGGRLAQIFAFRNRTNGMTFNSAAPSKNATASSGSAAQITNIFMEKDAVDELSDGFVLADDVGESFRFAFEFNSALGAHSMERMVQYMNSVARVYLDLMQPRILEMCAGQTRRSISPDLCSPPAILSPIGAGVGSLAGPSTGSVSPTPSGPATASGDFVGQWKGTVQQSGSRPYTIELSVRGMQVGSVVGTVAYPELSCVGTWTLESQQASEATFVEKITSGSRCISGIRVQMKVAQGMTAHLSWIGHQTQADVLKDRGTSLQTTASQSPQIVQPRNMGTVWSGSQLLAKLGSLQGTARYAAFAEAFGAGQVPTPLAVADAIALGRGMGDSQFAYVRLVAPLLGSTVTATQFDGLAGTTEGLGRLKVLAAIEDGVGIADNLSVADFNLIVSRMSDYRVPSITALAKKLRANLGPREVIEILGDSNSLMKLPALDELKGARRIRTPLSEAEVSAIAASFGFLEGQAREILMRP